jgi:NAD(P)-dependent dehydrogenase (short-subunit alcohol dehydrogenase family)
MTIFFNRGILLPLSVVFLAQQTYAFTPNVSINIHKHSQLSLSNTDSDGEPSDRRNFLTKAVAGIATTGIIANGFSVQGPSPYYPAVGSMTGKLVVITGGNTGLGLESGKRLAASGATVVLTSRSLKKGERAVQTIKDYVKEEKGIDIDNVYALPLDLCDLDNVKGFSKLFSECAAFKGIIHVDVLLNNAGVMAVPDMQITKDGFEKTFQTNHLGHFALTAQLVPLLNSDGARVVNVSSMAHLIASKGLDMSNLNGEKEYGPWTSYGASKLENILFTNELQRRANEAGKKITSVSLHPGAVRTDLARYIVGDDQFVSMQDASPTLSDELKVLPMMYFTKGVDRGSNSQIYLSALQGGDEVGGKFFVNMKDTKPSPAAMDTEQAKELWEISEKLSGVSFNF